MRRISLALYLLIICQLGFAQAQQRPPPNFPKKEFFGDALALLSFCNFHDVTDHFEMFLAFKELGVTAADKSEILAIRDKDYQIYRDKFSTPASQEELCKRAKNQFFFIKTRRKGVPLVAGSDTNKQPEKIKLFGNALGVMLFCKANIDQRKWWDFMFYMGINSESVTPLVDYAAKTKQALAARYGTPEKASDTCLKIKNNYYSSTFIKP